MKEFIELKEWEILMVISFFFLFLCGIFLIGWSIFEFINGFFDLFLLPFIFGGGLAWFSGYIIVEGIKNLHNQYIVFKLDKRNKK